MIVITVPHAKPHRNVERNEVGMPLTPTPHWCDWIAESAARLIHDSLPNSVLLIGDVNRTEFDLNRKESRKTNYRKNLDRVLANSDVKMLIDVHSADDNFFGDTMITLVEKDIRAWADYQVAAYIQQKAVIRMPKTLAGANATLVRNLNNAGISANIVSAWPTTLDILSQAEEHMTPCVLLEFNEEQFETLADLKRATDIVALWANELNHQ